MYDHTLDPNGPRHAYAPVNVDLPSDAHPQYQYKAGQHRRVVLTKPVSLRKRPRSGDDGTGAALAGRVRAAKMTSR